MRDDVCKATSTRTPACFSDMSWSWCYKKCGKADVEALVVVFFQKVYLYLLHARRQPNFPALEPSNGDFLIRILDTHQLHVFLLPKLYFLAS